MNDAMTRGCGPGAEISPPRGMRADCDAMLPDGRNTYNRCERTRGVVVLFWRDADEEGRPLGHSGCYCPQHANEISGGGI